MATQALAEPILARHSARMRSGRRKPFLCLFAGMAVGLGVGPRAARAECRMEAGPRRTVTRVIDGETLVLDDGREVRLAGALAPRGFDAGADEASWPAAVEAKTALAALAQGRNVALGFTGTTWVDRQGRYAAQVFVVEGGTETWLQGQMLSGGHARAYQQKDQRGCADELLAFEKIARDAGRGVWSQSAYQVRPAVRPRDLAGLAGTFVVLTGRVAWVATGRQTIALGFSALRSRAWGMRRGVIVMIENNDRDLRATFGGDALALKGQDVEVRGWLEQRLGRPAGTYVMDVSLAGLLVVTGSARAVAAATATEAPPTASKP